MREPLVPTEAGITSALVVGTGASGRAAAVALLREGVAVHVVDEADAPAGLDELTEAGATVTAGARPVEHLDGVDLLVPSPGVPEHAAVITTAQERGIPVWSEPELGIRLYPRRIVAITGTNGKTSVTELATAVLQAGGLDAVACGNIGTPVTEAAHLAAADAVLVAELSSFQLRFCHELAPEVGLLLNLAPDHLDWHGGFEAYGSAKARVWRAQSDGQWAVANADDDATTRWLDTAPAGRATFSGTRVPEGGVGVRDGVIAADLGAHRGDLLAVDDLPLTAPHHVANVASAAAVGLLMGVPADDVARAARGFRPGRHRVEHVVTIDGVDFVDDSKATNAHATAAALASFDSIVWIAGGIAKGVDLSVLGEHLGAVRHAVLIGEAAEELARVCRDHDIPARIASSMDEAVAFAYEDATDGDTVLLAPACSSFDMFTSYADRGDRFAAAVRRLAGEEAADGGR